MITIDVIRKVAPRARQDYIDALLAGAHVFEKYGITTTGRMAHFFAQILHETGGLTIVRENMNYTAKRIKQVWPSRPEAVRFANNPQGLANSVYNGRMGNKKGSNDGWLFRGGGMMQTTGRDNYERLERETKLPFATLPETIENPRHNLVAAAWEFSKFLSYADKGEKGLRAVSNGINRGNANSSQAPIGWEDRQLCYQRAVRALSVVQEDRDDVLELGEHGEAIRAAQERLTGLGYVLGKIDGQYGSRTRAAVLAFQAENGLATTGELGPNDLAVLNGAKAVAMPKGDRATEGAKELAAAGSQTIQATQILKGAAKAAGVAATGFATADQTGVADWMGSLTSDLNQFKMVSTEFFGVLGWAAEHWYFFVPLVAYGVWWLANNIEVRRVIAHQTGLDLTR